MSSMSSVSWASSVGGPSVAARLRTSSLTGLSSSRRAEMKVAVVVVVVVAVVVVVVVLVVVAGSGS